MSRRNRGPGRLAVLAGMMLWLGAPQAAVAGKPGCTYTVKKGDTVSRIARRKGVTEANLLRANPKLKKNPNRLRVGQKLEICAAKKHESRRPAACGKGGRLISHTVAKGQTVAGIAAKYSVSRDSVRRYNKRLAKRRNSMIRVGETLKICTTNRRYTHRAWLKEGVQLQPGDGFNIRRPNNAWGTPTTIAGISAILAQYRSLSPDAPDVQIGDISRSNGGPLRSHLSHQDGRDVDIGYVFEPRTDDPTRRKIDLEHSWRLLQLFATDDTVAAIFVDYRLQRRLYEYALAEGAANAELDAVFEYPRGGDREAVIVHWPGHGQHFHVRFKRTPVAAAGRS
ncbi:MAG: penicillin-insensitive murein endopeptidase [Myxococcota bacterium]